MGHNIDSFGVYVSARLNDWGREFALHRDCEYLGHRSKDRLQVLIEHRGEMPPRVTGFKPVHVPPECQQIEDIVADLARSNLTRATVMRAYYCGIGRRGVERVEIANEMLQRYDQALKPVSRTKYFVEHDLGFEFVRGVLIGYARAA
ncbi:hypothetical protein [Lysobacter fragariae]